MSSLYYALFWLIALLKSTLSASLLPSIPITDGEILELAGELRRADNRKAELGQILLDYQGHTSTREPSDNAKRKY